MEGKANVRIFNAHRREYKFINNFCHKSEGNGPSGVDSASNRNEYQKYFLEVKAAGA
jgi:hypothetical protein